MRGLQLGAQKSGFWAKQQEAVQSQRRLAELSSEIGLLNHFQKEISYLRELALVLEGDTASEKELEKRISQIERELKEQIQVFFLSGKYDEGPAIISIQAGAGGRDAEDWVCLLLNMYQKFCEKKKWFCRIIDQTFTEGGGPESRIGLKNVSLGVEGKFAFGFLKKEAGIHRLVRISPFSAKQLRHTSFARVEILPKIDMEIDESQLDIQPDELRIETFRSSGPGGQNVNKRETAVRIVHLPTGMQAVSQIERTQAANRKIALQFLVSRLIFLKEQEQEKELASIRGQKVSAEFGHQIRSYVLHPYKLVKDHRTGVEIPDVDGVLNGELEEFIEAELKL